MHAPQPSFHRCRDTEFEYTSLRAGHPQGDFWGAPYQVCRFHKNVQAWLFSPLFSLPGKLVKFFPVDLQRRIHRRHLHIFSDKEPMQSAASCSLIPTSRVFNTLPLISCVSVVIPRRRTTSYVLFSSVSMSHSFVAFRGIPEEHRLHPGPAFPYVRFSSVSESLSFSLQHHARYIRLFIDIDNTIHLFFFSAFSCRRMHVTTFR